MDRGESRARFNGQFRPGVRVIQPDCCIHARPFPSHSRAAQSTKPRLTLISLRGGLHSRALLVVALAQLSHRKSDGGISLPRLAPAGIVEGTQTGRGERREPRAAGEPVRAGRARQGALGEWCTAGQPRLRAMGWSIPSFSCRRCAKPSDLTRVVTRFFCGAMLLSIGRLVGAADGSSRTTNHQFGFHGDLFAKTL